MNKRKKKKKKGYYIVSSIKCLKLKQRPDIENKEQPAIKNNCCDKRDNLQIIMITIIITIIILATY